MKTRVHKIGQFYSKIFMKYIGLFLFTGFLSVVFGENGWYPNKDLNEIAEMAYRILVPSLIGYSAGMKVGGEGGAITGLMATMGVVTSDSRVGILGAMILGPLCGYCSNRYLNPWVERAKASLHMLFRNLLMAAFGGTFCLLGYFIIAPVLGVIAGILSQGIDFLITQRWIVFGNVLIEPAKVFFLNNVINHAVLTPLGIGQAEQTGRSVLFLMETNPGPGLGILFALWCRSKRERQKYSVGMFAQGIGGIHEVYFPFVMSRLRLLLALIAGGMAGTFCFVWTGVGLRAPVSPGSILTILMMTQRDCIPGVVLGIVVSFAVAFVTGWLLLQGDKKNDMTGTEIGKMQDEVQKRQIHRIGFVCDGGVGSSVMGAALFRRQLKENGLLDVTVQAYAVDRIPEDLDGIVCQKDYVSELPDTAKKLEAFSLDNLVSSESYRELLEEIKKRNG